MCENYPTSRARQHRNIRPAPPTSLTSAQREKHSAPQCPSNLLGYFEFLSTRKIAQGVEAFEDHLAFHRQWHGEFRRGRRCLLRASAT